MMLAGTSCRRCSRLVAVTTISVSSAESDARALSAAERQQFAEWFDDHRHDLIPPDDILTAQEQELRRRLAEMEANPALRERFSPGDLDALYCDEDGDLTADTPKDARRLKNPGTLVFTYTPVEDPAVYEKVFKPFTDHLAKCTAKRVVFPSNMVARRISVTPSLEMRVLIRSGGQREQSVL